MKHLEDFATVGLRTLCFAYCELDKTFYEQWKEKDYKPASTSVIDREQKLDAAYAKIEKDFTLVGASAIEDRLQDQVGAIFSVLPVKNFKSSRYFVHN